MENKKEMEKEQEQENAQNNNDVAFVAIEERVVSAAAKKDRVLPISILIAAVMIAAALVFATVYKGGNSGANGAANNDGANGDTAAAGGTAVAPSSASTTAILALNSRDAILGNANALVTVIEYGDYQCPYCGQYFSTIQPVIIKNYVDTGKVKMVFRDLPLPFLGPESIAAAGAAQCAEDQGKLWPYHDALYTAKLADVAKGGSEGDGFFNRALFMSIATQLSLNTSTFASCIDNNKDASIVTQERVGAEVIVGADSTPATVVNGVLVADSSGSSVGDNSTAVLSAIATAVAKAK